jgi:hypothetical protein
MIGAGTVISPVLRIVTTVAIIAAVSIFVVRPILDTTEKVSSDSQRRTERIQRQSDRRTEHIRLTVARTQALAAASSARAFGDQKRARRIMQCVRAAKSADKMDFCRAK